MHVALRCEAGLVTEKITSYAEDGTVLSPEDIWDGSLTSSGAVTAKRLRGAKEVTLGSGLLLSHPGSRSLSGELRAVDPVRMIRLRQFNGYLSETGGNE